MCSGTSFTVGKILTPVGLESETARSAGLSYRGSSEAQAILSFYIPPFIMSGFSYLALCIDPFPAYVLLF